MSSTPDHGMVSETQRNVRITFHPSSSINLPHHIGSKRRDQVKVRVVVLRPEDDDVKVDPRPRC